MAIFTGSGVAIVTPFHADGSINYDKLEQITNLHTDLKTSNNGYAYCTVISENASFLIQLWMSAFNRNFIYVAYVTDANTENPQVAWKKIALTN